MIKLLKQIQLFGSLQKFTQINQFNFCSYQQEARVVLLNAITDLQDISNKNKQLDILFQYYSRIWEGRLGLVDNKILFSAFLDNSINILRKEFAQDSIENDPENKLLRAVKIHHIFNTISELQIMKWDGVQDLLQWVRKKETYDFFVKHNKIHLYLKYINLLYINEYDISEFYDKIENAIIQFKQQTPDLVDQKLEYYKAINMLRQFDEIEKAHLKMTILDLSKLENRQVDYTLEQLEILTQYINIICDVFFANLLQERDIFAIREEDEEDEENLDDLSLTEPLARLVRLFLQQDSYWYKKSISKYRDKLYQKEGYVDLVDPLKWKQMHSIAKALWVLVESDEYDRTMVDMLENSIFRKLETDTASIRDGVEILKYIEEIPELKEGQQFMIMKSICDQINNQEFQDLSINRQTLANLLHQMLRLERKAEQFELKFIQPALFKLLEWIKQGKLDKQMNMCDWYDIQLVIKKHKFIELEEFVEQKLGQKLEQKMN